MIPYPQGTKQPYELRKAKLRTILGEEEEGKSYNSCFPIAGLVLRLEGCSEGSGLLHPKLPQVECRAGGAGGASCPAMGCRSKLPCYGMQEQGSRSKSRRGTDLPRDTSPRYYNTLSQLPCTGLWYFWHLCETRMQTTTSFATPDFALLACQC